MRKKNRSVPVLIGKQSAPSGFVTSVTGLLRSSRVTVLCSGHMQLSHVTVMFIYDGRDASCVMVVTCNGHKFLQNGQKNKKFTPCLISNYLHVMSELYCQYHSKNRDYYN